MLKYKQPEDVTDQVIREEFIKTDCMSLFVRQLNSVSSLSITCSEIVWMLPMTRVLPLVGITPQMLRPMFNPQQKKIKRIFPFNLSWGGLNEKLYNIVEVELPFTIETYEQLGEFRMSKDVKPFLALSRIFEKPVSLLTGDCFDGDLYRLCTVYPSGKIDKGVTGFISDNVECCTI